MYYDVNYPIAGATTGAGIGALLGGPAGAAAGGVTGGLFGAIGGFFGKKKKQDQPDPLAGLRTQLQALAGQVPAQVAKQKEINAARTAQYKTEGQQGIAENIRAERGFGNTSLMDRLNAELTDKLLKTQSEADLAAENWGIGQQANILSGTAGMYPGVPPEEQPSWATNLLGVGANMAVQNYMQDQQWKNLAKYFGGSMDTGSSKGGVPSGGGAYTDLINNPDWQAKYLKLG